MSRLDKFVNKQSEDIRRCELKLATLQADIERREALLQALLHASDGGDTLARMAAQEVSDLLDYTVRTKQRWIRYRMEHEAVSDETRSFNRKAQGIDP